MIFSIEYPRVLWRLDLNWAIGIGRIPARIARRADRHAVRAVGAVFEIPEADHFRSAFPRFIRRLPRHFDQAIVICSTRAVRFLCQLFRLLSSQRSHLCRRCYPIHVVAKLKNVMSQIQTKKAYVDNIKKSRWALIFRCERPLNKSNKRALVDILTEHRRSHFFHA